MDSKQARVAGAKGPHLCAISRRRVLVLVLDFLAMVTAPAHSILGPSTDRTPALGTLFSSNTQLSTPLDPDAAVAALATLVAHRGGAQHVLCCRACLRKLYRTALVVFTNGLSA